MRGRKTKPTALKLIQGNAGHRPIIATIDCRKPFTIRAPSWLTGAQKAIWRRATANLPEGVLGQADRELLIVWCVTTDLYETAVRMQATLDASSRNPLLIRSKKNGEPIESPYLRVMHKHSQTLIRVASELGFSPTSRAKIPVQQKRRIDAASALFGF